MLNEKVIITKLPITQVGQVVNFQIKIPRDALRIIGIELSGSHFVNIQPPAPPPPPPTQGTGQAGGQPIAAGGQVAGQAGSSLQNVMQLLHQ